MFGAPVRGKAARCPHRLGIPFHLSVSLLLLSVLSPHSPHDVRLG